MKNVQIEDLIIEHECLIYSIINKYKNFYDIDDLKQVAVIGMMKAISNYDNTKNVKFTTYAYKYILGEVYKFVNDNRDFRISKEYLGLEKKINLARDTLMQKLMRVPSNFELSLFLEIDEKIINHVDVVTAKMESLDRVIVEDEKNLTLLDKLYDKNTQNNIDNIYLYQALEQLENDEQKLVKNRYFLDRTQQETAEILGMNQVQVSRCEKRILKKLRTSMMQ